MERTNKRRENFLVISALFAALVLLLSNFSFGKTYASSGDNDVVLPDFLQKLLATLLPDASSETLNRIRAL